ncbi:hypothetical protein [Alcanivorax sp.]|uniref:hypothetical protein n=1 Tax=Alcanivorax sp. TaxID=1872427 RepID=UPI0025BBBC1F|nr:hypothetical protein [Alcanivorax sp.]
MITGKNVADAVFLDLESFFFYASKFKVAREYTDQARENASYVGSGNNARIKMSGELRNYDANSLARVFLVAIVVCHECAHYLNRHNDFVDNDEMDFMAIENWADYFGARIFGVIITFGKNTQKIMKKIDPQLDQEMVLKEIGGALGDIYRHIYLQNTDPRYSPAIDRVRLFNAGFTSFFYRLFGELKPGFTVDVLLKIGRAASLSDELGTKDVAWDKQSAAAKKMGQIHQKIQGKQPAITLGLKPRYIPLLVTNYHLSGDEIKANKQILMNQVERIGIKVDWEL